MCGARITLPPTQSPPPVVGWRSSSCAAKKLPGALRIGGGRAQFVEIARARVRIGGFEALLVGDRLFLDELDRYRAPLQIVEIEQAFAFAIKDNARELVGEINRVLDAAV